MYASSQYVNIIGISQKLMRTTSTPIIYPRGMNKESFTIMVCLKSHSPLHIEKIQFFKRKYFLCLVLCQEMFLWKAILHLYIYYMHIVMYHHAQRNSDI